MRKLTESRVFVVMLGIVMIMSEFSCLSLKANAEEVTEPEKEWNWSFHYTGNEQVFTAPYSGVYQFELYGAQGSSTGSKEGGKGGKITATIALKRNEKILIYVGGQDGYNGGGSGTVSSGGGATDIRINGTELDHRILIAGGGGGANNIYPGGKGGANLPGTGTTSEKGEDSPEGAGGGGGYQGGSAGTEHIVPHTHQGNNLYGGSCYSPDYHYHSGSEISGGGCYTIPNLHGEHTDNCYNHTPIVEGYWKFSGVEAGSSVPGAQPAYVFTCDLCGARMTSSGTGDSGKHCQQGGERTDLICGLDPSTVISYGLGCGRGEGELTGYHLSCTTAYNEYNVKQSTGGTNYFNNANCSMAVSEEGVNAGDGKCSVKLITLYNLYYDGVESLNVYYNGIKVKKVYYKGNLIYRE